MDIDGQVSNELRVKQQNTVKPRGDVPDLSPESFMCENLRLVFSAFMLMLLAFGLRTVLARWGWDKGTRRPTLLDALFMTRHDQSRHLLILYADPETMIWEMRFAASLTDTCCFLKAVT